MIKVPKRPKTAATSTILDRLAMGNPESRRERGSHSENEMASLNAERITELPAADHDLHQLSLRLMSLRGDFLTGVSFQFAFRSRWQAGSSLHFAALLLDDELLADA